MGGSFGQGRDQRHGVLLFRERSDRQAHVSVGRDRELAAEVADVDGLQRPLQIDSRRNQAQPFGQDSGAHEYLLDAP